MGDRKEDIKIADIFLSGKNDDADYIPLITEDDEDALGNSFVPAELPILPLRNTVLFPGVILPITVGRDKSLKLVREAYANDKIIGAVAQKDAYVEEPEVDDIERIGTVAQIIKILEMPDGSTSIIIQGKRRFEITNMVNEEPYFRAAVQPLSESKPVEKSPRFDAIIGSLKDLSLKIIKLSANIPSEISFAVKNIESSTFLVNFISSNTDINVEEKQELLEIDSLEDRGYKLLEYLTKEVQSLELKKDIQSKVKTELDTQQREYMLHQQMKTIQDELGGSPADQEVEELREKAADKKWDEETAKVFDKELSKLSRMNPAAGEYSVQINYLQTLVDLPWGEYTDDNFDLKNAESVLDRDHFGLEKVKDRILEHLAVLKLKGDLKSPIICLYGPPGVGKTSLGKSIADSLGRKYVRMSLGGLHDESEIRGHRKTYIGAMPGRIIYNIKKAASSNPVFILDEIDKIGKDVHGDPASALLEVLDPEQNNAFHDNYLELDYDLSKVMFIATANNIGTIQPALRDRMEMIDVSGYIVEEKIQIALRHLLPKQLEAHGVKEEQLSLTSAAIEYIIENYTRESGVRSLDKQIAKIARVTAKRIAYEEEYETTVDVEHIRDILGVEKFSRDKYQGNDYAGVVTGLAWTAVGGDILYIETSLSKGKGKLTLTGNLGDVMKESAVIALEYIKANADKLNIDYKVFDNWNIHVHVPEGAIPKDGPSAGITMATSLTSALTQRKVKKNIAMTGEITLRGKVLPVGGIKEKILAAKRAGIKEILMSVDNKKDVEDIKDIYLKGLTFTYVEDVMDVIDKALTKQKVKDPIKLDVE
jgi:ATP-dependent Lon protease